MKQVCYPRRANTVWLSVALLVVCLALVSTVLTSCGKKQPAQQPGQENEVAHITSEPAHSVLGKAYQKGIEPKCLNNLQQIRNAIDMSKGDTDAESDGDGTGTGFPPSLDTLTEIPPKMKSCPISHKPYQYDPQTGRVWCTFPGHEKL